MKKQQTLKNQKKKEQQKGKTQVTPYQHGEGGDRFVDGFFFHSIRRGRVVVVCTHISLLLMRFFCPEVVGRFAKKIEVIFQNPKFFLFFSPYS
jgi:hypothetical protein